ncbi:MAG: PAS domain-containing sensor histidine kinase [Methanofastidiosum sp.]|jgi:PAS domain S-box-containing protein|nr:PAS domain-containing sensor histidine kinase [Methanofastidiosum sp.]
MENNKNTKSNANKKFNTFQPNKYINQDYPLPNISVNKEGIIVFANEDTSRILGYPKKQLLGMEVTKIYLNPSDRDLLLKELYDKGSVHDFDVTFKRNDGEKINCRLDMSVFKDSEERILGHTGIIKDLQLECDLGKKLKQENQRLFSILEQLPVNVCLYDNRRNIIYANKSLKKRFEKIDSKKCYKLFYGTDKPCDDCPILDVFKNTVPKVYERTQSDGRIYEFHDYLFTDSDGTTFVLEMGIDITNRKAMEEDLKELNETLEIMNNVLRHDILNDLNVALNFCDLISTEDEDIKKLVMTAISKSVKLIENSREFEKVFNKKVEPSEIKLFDVKNKFSELVKNYPEIKLNIVGNCKIIVDESITTVFDNIVRNAKIHGKADKIDVSLKREGEYCEISFADNGVGIRSDIKDKVFEEGFSYGPTKGSGFGLYIAKKIIQRHKGQIKVNDNTPKGTIVTLKFKTEGVHEIC